MSGPRVLCEGFFFVESPRWHDDRLWFAHWGAGEIVAVDMDGTSEVVGEGSPGFGWSIDWLPDGTQLLTGEGLFDGSHTQRADLSAIKADWNEIVVDGRGNVFVNGGCDFDPPPGDPPGVVAVVRPDGSVSQVADALAFPNGMAVTPDNSTLLVAESHANVITAFDIAGDGTLANRRAWAKLGDGYPDGICLDAEGAAWYADVPNKRCVRVREGGEVEQTVELDRGAFACMLGGPDGRTLFILAADWDAIQASGFSPDVLSGQVLAFDAPAPHVGWP